MYKVVDHKRNTKLDHKQQAKFDHRPHHFFHSGAMYLDLLNIFILPFTIFFNFRARSSFSFP